MADKINKVNVFKRSVFDEANYEIKTILETANNEKNEILKKTHDELVNFSYSEVSEKTKAIKNDCKKQVSKRSFETKRGLLDKRNQIVEGIFADIKSELRDFCTSGKYETLIINKMKEAEKDLPFYDGVVAYVKNSDVSLKCLKSDRRLKIEPSKNIRIGGVAFYYPRENFYIDFTLDEAVNKEKVFFSQNAEVIKIDNL